MWAFATGNISVDCSYFKKIHDRTEENGTGENGTNATDGRMGPTGDGLGGKRHDGMDRDGTGTDGDGTDGTGRDANVTGSMRASQSCKIEYQFMRKQVALLFIQRTSPPVSTSLYSKQIVSFICVHCCVMLRLVSSFNYIYLRVYSRQSKVVE